MKFLYLVNMISILKELYHNKKTVTSSTICYWFAEKKQQQKKNNNMIFKFALHNEEKGF